MIKRQNYGWKRDLPDHRDLLFSAVPVKATKLVKVDLRGSCPPVVNQGALGSCTANAIGAAHHFEQMKQKEREQFSPSRLFIYYNERAMEGTVNFDAGAIIRDGFKSIAKQGVCPEPEWPYDISVFKKKPPSKCYKHALAHQALKYFRVMQNLNEMKKCLAEGYPFVFGVSVYESFESAAVRRTGMVPMPNLTESLLGGHAMLCVGFDDRLGGGRFIVRNSWGKKWGDEGYCYIPYAYLTNLFLAADFWTLRLVE